MSTRLWARRLEYRAQHYQFAARTDTEGHDRSLLHPPASVEHILGVRQGAVPEQGQDRLLRQTVLRRQLLHRLGWVL